MPLIDDEPPSTLPRGQCIRRPPRCGSGSVSYCQLYLAMFIGIDSALGIWISTDRSEPPNSSTSDAVRRPRVSRSASTQPADPAPTMT